MPGCTPSAALHRPLLLLAATLLATAAALPSPSDPEVSPAEAPPPGQGSPLAQEPAAMEAEIEAARALFERNLEAIRQRDRDAYLACYLDSGNLVRVGPEGPVLGYEGHAAQSTETSWPDVFEAVDLRLIPIRPGVVFGTYRYRVRYGPTELRGLSERIFLQTAGGWKIAMTSAFPEPEGTQPAPRAFTGATLVDGTGRPPVRDSVVVMRSGRIECAGTREQCPVPDGAIETPLQGFWVTPGLIDAHVHFSQTGYADGRPDFADIRRHIPYESAIADLRDNPGRLLQSYLCSGVTAVFDNGGFPWTLGLRRRSEGDALSPRVVAAGPLLAPVEAPILSLPGERQILRMDDAEGARALARYVKTAGSSALKIWWVNAQDRSHEEVEALVAAAMEEARALELPVIAHATSLDRAKAAVRLGARVLVHSVEDREVDEEFLRLAREKEIVYCPTLTVREGYLRLREALIAGKAVETADPLACVDPATRARLALTASFSEEYLNPAVRESAPPSNRKLSEANLRKVRDAGIRIAMGTDAGNPLTLHGESVLGEMRAMQEAGMSPMEVLVAATKGSATAMGRLGDLGTVERGKMADLLVLAADPTESVESFLQLTLVVRGGIVRHQAELRAPEH